MKKVFLSALAIAAMASCSKTELSNTPDGSVEIKAKSTALSISTKSPYEGTISSGNPLTAQVLVSKTDGKYTSRYCDGEMTFSDDGTTEASFATPQYYPADGSVLYLCGLYPSDLGGWGTVTESASRTFDGKTDIMAAAQQQSSKSEAQTGTYPTMQFKHLLTKLVVKLVAEDDAAVTAWGNVTDISLVGVNGSQKPYSKVEVALRDGTAVTGSAFSTTVENFSFYTMTENTYNDVAFSAQTLALTKTAANAAYSLVAPITATGTGDFKLRITTQKDADSPLVNEVAVDLKDTSSSTFTGDTQGKAFEITLTFKATEIQAKASVKEWENAGTSINDTKTTEIYSPYLHDALQPSGFSTSFIVLPIIKRYSLYFFC
mgnify:CR=1 FL=1